MTAGKQIRTTVRLDDKYNADVDQVFLNGTQALIRLLILQRRRDAARGLNTGGYVSGYRGSPLGALDQQLAAIPGLLKQNDIIFEPGLNEDLAATAVWGTQQLGLAGSKGRPKVDGVFGLWYGKGPGVDRSGDAFRHANLAGTHPNGGVLAVAGDDHTCKSSTTAHHSEWALMDAAMPVLNPTSVREFVEFGLFGYSLSRFSGAWVGLKCVAETIETTASVDFSRLQLRDELPPDFEPPRGGLHLRWPDGFLDQEERLYVHKPRAIRAFTRHNRFDRVIFETPVPRIGIVTTGKSYADSRQALEQLGFTPETARKAGVEILKVGLVSPLDTETLLEFAGSLNTLVFIEEKRPVIEPQAVQALYHLPADQRPRIIGKSQRFTDGAAGRSFLPDNGELTPRMIAAALDTAVFSDAQGIGEAAWYSSPAVPLTDTAPEAPPLARTPYFCAGCPHNSSTVVPEGSRALGGIGCHTLALFMDRDNATFTHMGAEGAPWIGLHHFTDEEHVFVNLGDGTYNHSGILAIRAAARSGANITYKLLYNDAVAMTGGQSLGENMTPQDVAAQVRAEGVRRVVLLTEDLTRYPGGIPATEVLDRRELPRIQQELRETPGTTVLIFDQTCAAEKRRRRKRGQLAMPDKRLEIHPEVCEGCGDCGRKSNCVAIAPLETELGRKRKIDQSACNLDFTCSDGFCPSFVTVQGSTAGRKTARPASGSDAGAPASEDVVALPDAPVADISNGYGIYVAGIGGTGVVTVGALLGMAAHIDGRAVAILDMMGMAQKGGAVVSHLQFATTDEAIHAARLADGGADLILGCDQLTAGQPEALAKMAEGRTRAVINSQQTLTGAFTKDPDLIFPEGSLQALIAARTGQDGLHVVDASAIATRQFGDSIAANLFLLGVAAQKGLLPVSVSALEQTIALNGVAKDMNLAAFEAGRRYVVTPEVFAVTGRTVSEAETAEVGNDGLIADRTARLTAYQSAAYARQYAELLHAFGAAVAGLTEEQQLTEALARNAYKVMAYKDEYEVARLLTDPAFEAQVRAAHGDGAKISYNLAPPVLSGIDGKTGEPRKREFGPALRPALKVLAGFRRLRGTVLDPFGYLAERKAERAFRDQYLSDVRMLTGALTAANAPAVLELLELPGKVRGYGHIKLRAIREVEEKRTELLKQLST